MKIILGSDDLQAFLTHLAKYGSPRAAAEFFGFSIHALRNRRKYDREFRHRWDCSVDRAVEHREELRRTNALEGRPSAMEMDTRLDIFLEELAVCGSVAYAADAAGISPSTARKYRREDPDFGECWSQAMEFGNQALEDEARRRAVLGVDKAVFYQGVPVETVKEYSDTLLIQLLKAHFPERYRERRSLELAGEGGGPVRVAAGVNLSTLSTEELRVLYAISVKVTTDGVPEVEGSAPAQVAEDAGEDES